MKTSIIILNYNYARFLPAAIDSALGQSWKDIEVIVVDDGSTDNSLDVVKPYTNQIRLLTKANGGAQSAINAGTKLATGDVVIYLDADDILLPQIVETVIAEFQTKPQVVRVQYPFLFIDAQGKPLENPPWSVHADWINGSIRQSLLSGHLHWWPPTSCHAFRMNALKQALPVPDEDVYRTSGFDTFLMHVSLLFGEVASLSQPGTCYRNHGQNNFVGNAQEIAFSIKNIRRVLRQQELLFERIEKIAKEQGENIPVPLMLQHTGALRLLMATLLLGEPRPYATNRWHLAVQGIKRSCHDPRLAPFGRLMSVLWFAAVGLLPTFLAKLACGIYFDGSLQHLARQRIVAT